MDPIASASSIFRLPSKKNYITAASELMNILNLDKDVRAIGSRSKTIKLDVKISDPLIPNDVITPDKRE